MSATTLVTFKEGKLTLTDAVSTISGLPRVISMVGKGRRGKSTFMNAIVSHMASMNLTPFQTSDGDEHCTKSIDAYYFEEQNLLLLDSKGLDYEDSRNDPALLLFLHQVSDIIIFNDRQRLDNSALKLLEPICAFSNYINMDDDTPRKPKLVFRIADCEIKDIGKAIHMLLETTYDDQYQSIRNTIRLLFDADIQLIKTEQLDRAARKLLDSGHLLEMLGQEEYGFRAAIEAILSLATSAQHNSIPFNDLVHTVVNKINGNEDIAIEKLDVVKLSAEADIRRWERDSVPSILFTPINVDGTQKCYNDVVEPRKNEKKRVLKSFTIRFRAVAAEIRTPFYEELSNRLAAPILAATEASKNKARAIIAPLLTARERDHDIGSLTSEQHSITTATHAERALILQPFEDLLKACSDIYYTVKDECTTWISQQISAIEDTITSIKAEEAVESEDLAEICNITAENFNATCMSHLSMIDTKILTQTNTSILTALRENVLDLTVPKLDACVTRRRITFKMRDKKVESSVELLNLPAQLCAVCGDAFRSRNALFTHIKQTGHATATPERRVLNPTEQSQIQKYDLVKPHYDDLVMRLNTCIAESGDLSVYLTGCKEEMMRGKAFKDITIVKVNPDIDFVWDWEAIHSVFEELKDVRGYYMTAETHRQMFMPMYNTIQEKLECKGIIAKGAELFSNKQGTSQNVTVLKRIAYSPTTKYEQSVNLVWKHQFNKVFCQETVKGFTIPLI